MNSLFSYSRPHLIDIPFVKASFGGVVFGLSDSINSKTGTINSNFIKSLNIEKYGSGAVNTYTLNMKYVIGKDDDPNLVDRIISKASDRKIEFTYGDLAKPEYSYKKEQAIISEILPKVDYRNNCISYTIKATSSTYLQSSIKRNFPRSTGHPSQVILNILYDKQYGLLDLLPGMTEKDKVLANNWIPTKDKSVEIEEKLNISPMDYILYLVSIMEGLNGCFYFLKIIDSLDNNRPHFEIISTDSKMKSQMLNISVGYPGSIPVYNLEVSENSSIAILVDYRDEIDHKQLNDYSFRGDLVSRDYYSTETLDGRFSGELSSWWKKMAKFPLTATLTTQGLFVPAEIIQSIYLDIGFFGKKYWHSGEYLIMSQVDSISSSGYKTTLGLMRIGGDNV